MKVLLCMSVLLAGALAAPSIDSEQQAHDANMELNVAAVPMDAYVEKRDVCDGYRMEKAGMCIARLSDSLSNLANRGPCRMRNWLVSRMNRCARRYGCEDNEEMRNAMNAGIQKFDQSMKSTGITC